MKKVDLNVDIGEGLPFDEALLEFATSANVCCGVYAGSEELTRQTIEMCKAKEVRIGVHPGYPNREAMGRETTPLTEALASLPAQLARFGFDEAAYVKPHGSLYNLSAFAQDRDERTSAGSSRQARIEPEAARIVEAIFGFPATPRALLGLAGTGHELLARRSDLTFIREGFADRAYTPTGRLVPRGEPGAILDDPAQIRAQVLELAPQVDSICLHGDTPGCLEFAEMVRRTLEDAGFEVGW